MKNKAILLLAIILCFVCVSCGANTQTDVGAANDGIDFTGMSAQLLSGEQYDLKDEIGANRICIVNIWATFCGPCISEMPELDEIYREYPGTIGVVGICADCSDYYGNIDDELLKTAQKIANDDLGLSYPNVVPSKEMQEYFLNEVEAVPLTYIVDDKGTILESFYGKRSKEEFLKTVNKYLAEE